MDLATKLLDSMGWNDVTTAAKTNCGLFGFDAGNVLGTDWLWSTPDELILNPKGVILRQPTTSFILPDSNTMHSRSTSSSNPKTNTSKALNDYVGIIYSECSMRRSCSRSLAPRWFSWQGCLWPSLSYGSFTSPKGHKRWWWSIGALNWATGETVAVKEIQLSNIPKAELGEIMVWCALFLIY